MAENFIRLGARPRTASQAQTPSGDFQVPGTDRRATKMAATGQTHKEEVKTKKRVVYRDEIYDKTTRTKRLVPSGPKRKRIDKPSSVAVFVRRVYSEKNVFVKTEVDIRGKLLLQVLKTIHKDTRGVSLGEGRYTVQPELLFWSKDELESHKEHLEALPVEDQDDTQRGAIWEIEAALEFVKDEYEVVVHILETVLDEHKITFETLWTILAPNTLVYHKDEFGNERVSWLRSSAISREEDGSYSQRLMLQHIDSDGTHLGVVSSSLKIPQFDGASPITDLRAYPVRFHRDPKALRIRLLERGREQLGFHGKGHCLREHIGYGYKRGERNVVKFKTHGRLIVDAATYEDFEPEDSMVPHIEPVKSEPSMRSQAIAFGFNLPSCEVCKASHDEAGPAPKSTMDLAPKSSTQQDIAPEGYPSRSRSRKTPSRRTNPYSMTGSYPPPVPPPMPGQFYDPAVEQEGSGESGYYLRGEISEIHVIMLSGKVYGFSLGDTTWGTFSVSNVHEVAWNEQVIHSLVMQPEAKRLLRQLVLAHSEGESGFDDIVRGKGKGLIGLLLGPPGVGKTLTAEAVAEISRLPLFLMSCGGLGSSAAQINKSLKIYLDLATRWRAVLLLDEADVYLAKRNENDLDRNAIVSVFLREIEYYTGILILTTNRAQEIDPAFQSRIHFCHHYHQHGKAARTDIWRTFIRNSAENKKIVVSIDDRDLSRLADLDLNGREIKNAMSLAVSLAASDKNDNVLRAQKIIDISQLLQNFDFVGPQDPVKTRAVIPEVVLSENELSVDEDGPSSLQTGTISDLSAGNIIPQRQRKKPRKLSRSPLLGNSPLAGNSPLTGPSAVTTGPNMTAFNLARD